MVGELRIAPGDTARYLCVTQNGSSRAGRGDVYGTHEAFENPCTWVLTEAVPGVSAETPADLTHLPQKGATAGYMDVQSETGVVLPGGEMTRGPMEAPKSARPLMLKRPVPGVSAETPADLTHLVQKGHTAGYLDVQSEGGLSSRGDGD
jgi:hypothetical protein